jgi:glycosyltransferase involved in cell wall biosynthesis
MESFVKKLLAVSWTMPPLLLPRSIQIGRNMKGLHKLGWDTTIIRVNPASAKNSRLDSSLEEKYAGYYRCICIDSDEDSWKWEIAKKIFFMFDQPSYYQWGWVGNAVKAARNLLRAEDFSALITFSQPWSDHLVGLRLNRVSKLPWIAHFSDPWADSPFIGYPRFQHPIVRRMEEAVICEADAVIFVSSQTEDLVMGKYPRAWRGKSHVIPHSYDPLENTGSDHVLEKGKLRMRYMGNFYGPRTPESFFRALNILNEKMPLVGQLEVMLAGQGLERFQPVVESLGLTDVVTLRGQVPLEKSQELSAEADVLLVIDAPSEKDSLFLPSKLVDYLAFKKIILGITPLRGASADLLREVNCPIAAPDDVPAIAAAVEKLLVKWRDGRLKLPFQFEQAASKYELNRTAESFDKIFEQVIKEKNNERTRQTL